MFGNVRQLGIHSPTNLGRAAGLSTGAILGGPSLGGPSIASLCEMMIGNKSLAPDLDIVDEMPPIDFILQPHVSYMDIYRYVIVFMKTASLTELVARGETGVDFHQMEGFELFRTILRKYGFFLVIFRLSTNTSLCPHLISLPSIRSA